MWGSGSAVRHESASKSSEVNYNAQYAVHLQLALQYIISVI